MGAGARGLRRGRRQGALALTASVNRFVGRPRAVREIPGARALGAPALLAHLCRLPHRVASAACLPATPRARRQQPPIRPDRDGEARVKGWPSRRAADTLYPVGAPARYGHPAPPPECVSAPPRGRADAGRPRGRRTARMLAVDRLPHGPPRRVSGASAAIGGMTRWTSDQYRAWYAARSR